MQDTANIPNIEPQKITAGFSVRWRRFVESYPPSLYTLRYAIRRADGTGPVLQIMAIADPNNSAVHYVDLAPSITAPLASGDHILTGWVTDDATQGATERVQVYTGSLSVIPDPLSATTEDRRSYYRKLLDAMREAYLKIASKTVSNVSIQGKAYTLRNLGELRAEINRIEERVQNEDQIARFGRVNRGVYARYSPLC